MFIPLLYSWKFLQHVNVYPVHVQVSTTTLHVHIFCTCSFHRNNARKKWCEIFVCSLITCLAHCVRIVVQKCKGFVHKNSPSYENSVYTCMWCLMAPCMYIHFLLTGYLGPHIHVHRRQHFWHSFIQFTYTCTCMNMSLPACSTPWHTVCADVDIREVVVEYSSGSIYHSVCHTWVDT